MMAQIDLQVVYSHAKGMAQLFIGDFSIGLPPALCEQLEKELAAARRIPEQAAAMMRDEQNTNHGPGDPLSHSPLDCRANEAGDGMERKTSAVAREPEITG